MPRTTLAIDDDALAAAKEHARRRGQTLGEAVSDLVRRATRRELTLDRVGGFAVVRLPLDSPVVTSERVKQTLDETP